jgi:Protein of unknown function/Domain of unknown function (DUF1835)
MIHVFFCASAAGTFRQLLNARGIVEKVADLSEELDFGPISHGELVEREQWLNQNIPMELGDRDWLAESEVRFRRNIALDVVRLIWIAPASASEQAGLYWYISNFGVQNISMAVADFAFGGTWNEKSPLRLGELGVEPMGQLYDVCIRTPWNPTRFPEDRWNALVTEKALLRVVNNGQLVSAPDNYFDDFLLARCSDEWVKFHRVIGNAMGDIWDTGQSASSELLLWRLRVLIAHGKIACDGGQPLFGGASNAVKIKRP